MNALRSREARLFLVAVLTAFGPLAFHYVGEEAILTITSIEMWQRGDWLRLWMYGGDAMHGVFANWLIIPLAEAFGWSYVLPAARAVMVISTMATGLLVYGLLRRLGRDASIAVLAAVAYITFADILIYRGWLAYRDPLFGFLVFAAIAALWIGARESRVAWYAASALAAFAAFLTKGMTAYVFIGGAVLVLFAQAETRRSLLRPAALLAGALALALPLLWLFGVQSGGAQAARYAGEIGAKLLPPGLGEWAVKLVTYPLETMLRLLPASGVAIFAWLKRPQARAVFARGSIAWTAGLIALIGFLPYWLAPHSHFRYLLPLAPLAAIVFAELIAQGGESLRQIAHRLMWAAVGVKLLFVAVGFPLYQVHYRGANYAQTAQDILVRTQGHALYAINVSASGLSVVALLNVARLPAPALTWMPGEWQSGFVIAYEPDEKIGRIAAQYRLGGNELYLLCRGAACAAQPAGGLRR
jgi:4-amino-4-deoxy-L-arabinose transferase-like glycosyltransferase